MENTLIWGMYLGENRIHDIEGQTKWFWTYINYHRLSIKKALDLNYQCHIYISENIKKYFKDLNVTIHIVTNLNFTFFDFITNFILKSEHNNCYIIDGDLILNKRLPELSSSIIFERLETNVWNALYEPYVNCLNKLNINTIIPEWTGKKYTHLINIGILKIKDNEFLKTYLDRWDAFKAFVELNKTELFYTNDTINTNEYTIIGAQYLLTELVNYYNLEYLELNSFNYTTTTPYYVHYMGKQKFTNGVVPYNSMLQFEDLNIL
jgi:hypothetical protein